MSRLTQNIFYNLSGQGIIFIFNIVLGLLSVRYIFKDLGQDVLGIIYFISTIDVIMLASIRKGISSNAVREISSNVDVDPQYVSQFIGTWTTLAWGAFVFWAIMIYLFSPFLVEKWLNLQTLDASTAIYMMRVLGIGALLALPKSFYISLISGVQRMEYTNLVEVAGAIVQRVGTILIIISKGNVYHIIYWFTLCYILQALSCFIISSNFFPIKDFIPRYYQKILRKNIKFSLHMISISVLDVIQNRADKLVLSKLMTVGTLGYYTVGFNNISRAKLVTRSIGQAAFPAMCEDYKEGGRQKLVAQYKILQELICFITIPIFAAIPFASRPLFTYVFNSEVASLLLLPIFFLCMGFYMNGTLTMPYQLSLVLGRADIFVRQSIYSLVIVVPATVLLVSYVGITGASLGWVIYFLVGYLYSVPRICRECMEISLWSFFKPLATVFLLTGLTYGLSWFVLLYIKMVTILSLCFAYLGASCIFFIAANFLISKELRELIVRRSLTIRNKIISKIIPKTGKRQVKLREDALD